MVRALNLLSPSALLWLLPLGGFIVVLYLLRMRRRDLRVPASFLWPAETQEVRANTLFQRLRFNWLMVLQLLALALLVLGLAGPQIRSEGLGGRATVVVLDASASMRATDVEPSRFGVAQSEIESLIELVRPGDRLALVEAGPSPRVVFSLSNDPAAMRAALDRLEPIDAEADIGAAMRLASSLVARSEGARIVLISDGAFEDVTDFAAGRAELTFTKVGEGGNNASIRALGASETEVFVGLTHSGSSPVSGRLVLLADGQSFEARNVSLSPGQDLGITVAAPQNSAVIEARLEVRDNLLSDNYAATVRDPGAKVRTLLVGPGNFFLERALALEPRVVLDRAASVPESADYDLVIFDGVPEVPVRARGVLSFGATSELSPVTDRGVVQTPVPTLSRTDHPLMEGVSFRDTYIDQGRRAQAKSAAIVLAESTAGPLVVLREGTPKQIWVGFKPLESDFPLHPEFPIFLANAVDFLVPRETVSDALAVRAGQPFALPALTEESARLTNGSTDTRIAPVGGQYVVREARTVGQYRLQTPEGERTVYATLQSTDESTLTPREQVLLGGEAVTSETPTFRMGEAWKPALWIALIVLAFEWWLFARRS